MTPETETGATEAQLIKTGERLIESADKLHQSVNSEKRWRKIVVALFALNLVVLMVGSVGVVQSRTQSRKNGDILTELEDVANLLVDATTPGGEIYERGAKSTNTLVCRLVEEQRRIHGIDLPCTEPLPTKPETAPSNVYRGEDGFCGGMPEAVAVRLGLSPDPSCLQ